MGHTLRSQIAILLIATSAVIGMTAWTLDRVDPGMTFGGGLDAQGRQTLVVASVQPGGLAWYEGARAGDVVLNVGGDSDFAGRWSSPGGL